MILDQGINGTMLALQLLDGYCNYVTYTKLFCKYTVCDTAYIGAKILLHRCLAIINYLTIVVSVRECQCLLLAGSIQAHNASTLTGNASIHDSEPPW